MRIANSVIVWTYYWTKSIPALNNHDTHNSFGHVFNSVIWSLVSFSNLYTYTRYCAHLLCMCMYRFVASDSVGAKLLHMAIRFYVLNREAVRFRRFIHCFIVRLSSCVFLKIVRARGRICAWFQFDKSWKKRGSETIKKKESLKRFSVQWRYGYRTAPRLFLRRVIVKMSLAWR